MKKSKTLIIKYLLLILGILTIILIAGGQQLPKYASRLPFIGVLAVIDLLYWLSIRKTINIRFKTILGFAYWLPIVTLLLFFILGIISNFSQWTAFPRIYFPAILLILLIGKGIFLLLLLLGDAVLFPIYKLKNRQAKHLTRPDGYSRPRIFLTSISVISIFGVILFFSGMIFWVSDFKLNTVELPVKNLPEEFDGYKIIQLSDMHLGTFPNDASLKKISKIVNSQSPDLILFTGDIVNLTSSEAFPFENVLKGFSSNDGNFSILGNHDYGEYNHWDSELEKQQNDQDLFDFYKRINWRLLRNENVVIKKGNASVVIVGVENWSQNKRFGKKGDLQKATKGTDSTQFQILMSHDPSHWGGEVISQFPQIGLTLSGHTHAFQIAVEIGSFKWSPASMLYPEWAGLYEKEHKNGKKQFLYVNRGCGTIGYPGRIFTKPEITLIILKKTH